MFNFELNVYIMFFCAGLHIGKILAFLKHLGVDFILGFAMHILKKLKYFTVLLLYMYNEKKLFGLTYLLASLYVQSFSYGNPLLSYCHKTNKGP